MQGWTFKLSQRFKTSNSGIHPQYLLLWYNSGNNSHVFPYHPSLPIPRQGRMFKLNIWSLSTWGNLETQLELILSNVGRFRDRMYLCGNKTRDKSGIYVRRNGVAKSRMFPNSNGDKVREMTGVC
jgi:hypothetical protein